MTIMRSQLVRARFEKPVNAELLKKLEDFCALFNGDLRATHIQHYCINFCCEGQNKEVTVKKTTALLLDLVFSHLGTVDSPCVLVLIKTLIYGRSFSLLVFACCQFEVAHF